ncbi:hypothetical protein NQU34_24500, partial [Escherichia coli]|uniref:hypothetical protein n=1 Tax=Escherichia coli TaxID=562 RepID=UPI0021197B11
PPPPPPPPPPHPPPPSPGLQPDRPDNGAQVSGNYQHLSSAGEWDISGTYAANDYSSVSSSWSDTYTATQYGDADRARQKRQ